MAIKIDDDELRTWNGYAYSQIAHAAGPDAVNDFIRRLIDAYKISQIKLGLKENQRLADQDPPLYAKAGGPPDGYTYLEILKDGVLVDNVYEVNVAEGWAVINELDDDGRYSGMKVTDHGNFEIRRKPKGKGDRHA